MNDILFRKNNFSEGYSDAFITKMSLNGSILWSQFVGGSGMEGIGELAYISVGIDSQDRIIMAGTTKSSDFPLTNAIDSTF